MLPKSNFGADVTDATEDDQKADIALHRCVPA